MFRAILIICLFTTSAFAQKEFIFERYTTAWVKQGAEFNEQYPIIGTNLFKRPKMEKVVLLIPSDNVIERNGGKFIKAYLINNTQDSIKLSRSDATIASMITEIKIGNEWKIFQIKQSSSCGNSYWTMNFMPKHYLGLEIENRLSGDIKMPTRVKMKVGDQIVTSNQTYIYVTKELLALAGTAPRDFFFSKPDYETLLK